MFENESLKILIYGTIIQALNRYITSIMNLHAIVHEMKVIT